jgi:hypothetical protein
MLPESSGKQSLALLHAKVETAEIAALTPGGSRQERLSNSSGLAATYKLVKERLSGASNLAVAELSLQNHKLAGFEFSKRLDAGETFPLDYLFAHAEKLVGSGLRRGAGKDYASIMRAVNRYTPSAPSDEIISAFEKYVVLGKFDDDLDILDVMLSQRPDLGHIIYLLEERVMASDHPESLLGRYRLEEREQRARDIQEHRFGYYGKQGEVAQELAKQYVTSVAQIADLASSEPISVIGGAYGIGKSTYLIPQLQWELQKRDIIAIKADGNSLYTPLDRADFLASLPTLEKGENGVIIFDEASVLSEAHGKDAQEAFVKSALAKGYHIAAFVSYPADDKAKQLDRLKPWTNMIATKRRKAFIELPSFHINPELAKEYILEAEKGLSQEVIDTIVNIVPLRLGLLSVVAADLKSILRLKLGSTEESLMYLLRDRLPQWREFMSTTEIETIENLKAENN